MLYMKVNESTAPKFLALKFPVFLSKTQILSEISKNPISYPGTLGYPARKVSSRLLVQHDASWLKGAKQLSVQCFSLKAHGMIGGWLVFQPKVDPHVIICVEILRIVRHHQPSPLTLSTTLNQSSPVRKEWFGGIFYSSFGGVIIHIQELHPGRLPWNIQTNHPFRKEHDLPNLYDYVPC